MSVRQPTDSALEGTRPGGSRGSWWSRNQKRLVPYIFIAPNIIVFTVFIFVPILFAFYISLTEWSLIGTREFIGLGNYLAMAQDGQFWRSLFNTLIYTIGTVPTSIALGLLVALGLNRKLPARALLRSIFFVPVIISLVAVALIASWMFNDNYGVVNAALGVVGLEGVPWLSSAAWAMPSLVITTLWIRVGFCMVIYSLHVFDLIYVMTGGGPGFSTTVLVQYIYEMAFQESEMGYASAVGVVLYVLLLIFTVFQWRVTRQGQNV